MKKYYLKEVDFIGSAFTRIPTNSNIDKGRCGIGGTNLELQDDRHSIIVVPNLSAIESKQINFKNLLAVIAGVKQTDITEYINERLSSKQYIKIMTTPESLYKIINAGEAIGFDIRKNCFLLIDEVHATITEGNYRLGIYKAFDFFFEFSDKSIISATPLKFSDKRFEALEQVKIELSNVSKKEIKIIFSKDVLHALKDLTKYVTMDERGNIHIFLNSVNEIAKFISVIGEEGVSIFCAEKSRNEETLNNFKILIRNTAKDGFAPSKINLYTSKYFEAWDMYDDNATIVIVSDVDNPQTCIDIETKAVQALGRLRKHKPKEIYHVTNTKELAMMEVSITTEELRNEIYNSAKQLINHYNYILSIDWLPRAKQDIFNVFRPRIEKFCNFDNKTGEAVLDDLKIDTEVHHERSLLKYSNRDTIRDSWTNAGYKVNEQEDSIRLSSSDRKKIKKITSSRAQIRRLVLEDIHLHINSKNKAISSGNKYFGEETLNELIVANPELYSFYKCLGYQKIVELKFSYSAMKKECITKYNNGLEVGINITKLLELKFQAYNFYSSLEVKQYLKEIYSDLGLQKIAKGSDILKYFYGREKTKLINSKVSKGYLLSGKRITF